MATKSLTIDQILTILTQSPSHISALTAGLPPAQLHMIPEHDQWSANDVLSHLRSCSDVWGDCIATILEEDRPTIRAINPVTWMKRTDYPQLEFQRSCEDFTTQRRDLLALLESLDPEAWLRWATVTGAGKPLQRSVQFYAQWLATHERSHHRQIKRIAETVRE